MIPIDASRWYVLNSTDEGFGKLFNGKEEDRIELYGALLQTYEAYYPVLEGEEITIDSIMMFDWQGTNEDQPMVIYAVKSDWNRVPIAVFTGKEYNKWVGPDPEKPEVYALNAPLKDIKYLVISSKGGYPGEIEFYGAYKPPVSKGNPTVRASELRNYFGVNAFEWDFEDPNAPAVLDPGRTAAIQNFTGVRHYMDWEKLEGAPGQYAFAPTYNGGWNYDIIYKWCKDNHIDMLPCLKTIPAWMQATYPEGERDNECSPLCHGKDPADPRSYVEQARVGFQFAARYGRNANVDRQLLKVKGDNEVKVGMDLINYLECENERDKWWKGRKAYQTGREYAANLSAFYDGHKGTMGSGVGVKKADPTMKVVMGGVAMPTTDYLQGMIDWSREHRGVKADGTVDVPWDVINYHFYANDASTTGGNDQKTGVAPEIAHADSFAADFLRVAHRYLGDMPVWITEAGYDIHNRSVQKAPQIGARSALATQADWILRTSLLYARSGIQKVFYYELYDDNAGNDTRYATSGLVEKNRQCRPAADYMRQTKKLFGSYVYKNTLNKYPLVDRYTFGNKEMYVLHMPDQKGKTGTYMLNVGKAAAVTLHKPAAGKQEMDVVKLNTKDGKVNVPVSETPVFVTPI